MAKSKNHTNGKLDEALTALIHSQATLHQTQAVFTQNQAAFTKTQADLAARFAETDRLNSERFARIEVILADHSRILEELIRMIEALPEAVREKIGFKMPQTQE